MKSTLLLFCLASASPASLHGAVATPPTEPDHPTLVVKKMVEPRMPQRALDIGVIVGEVRLVISVDSTGTLTDWLIIGYTHPYLVDAVVDTIKHWEFEAPRWHGEPISIQRELTIDFENRGTAVVTMNVAHIMEALMAQRFPDKFVFRPSTLKEIDKIPTPLTTTKPVYVKRTAAQGPAEVTVEFFIDQTGAVRLPSVADGNDPDLAASAVDAVRSWRFEPPTRQGHPVLVRAQQKFHFQ